MVCPMSQGEEKNQQIEAVVIDPGRKPESSMKSLTKKYIVVGVSSVLVVALILVGFLVGFYMFTDTFNKITSMSMQIKPNVYQGVDADLTTNVVEYRVKENNVEAIFLDDYNSFVEVVKVNDPNYDPLCYVNQMNQTDKVDLSQIRKPDDSVQKNFTKTLFVRTKMPIPDISFLNKKARTMCKGISTYWVIRACPATMGDGAGKTKRGICRKVCSNICKFFKKRCSKYCWLADVGCYLYPWLG